MKLSPWFVFAGFVLLNAIILPAQSGNDSQASKPSPRIETTAVFRASSRLVIVDVIATNDKGEFVPGLKPDYAGCTARPTWRKAAQEHSIPHPQEPRIAERLEWV